MNRESSFFLNFWSITTATTTTVTTTAAKTTAARGITSRTPVTTTKCKQSRECKQTESGEHKRPKIRKNYLSLFIYFFLQGRFNIAIFVVEYRVSIPFAIGNRMQSRIDACFLSEMAV